MRTTDWSRFQVAQIGFLTYLKRNFIHTELIAAALARRGAGILEIGVGSGAQSAALSRWSRTITVDNSRRILEAARPNLRRFGPETILVAGDGFGLPFPDRSLGVSISQGLLEHFDPADVGALMREQMRVCDSAVFSVPSDNYPHQDVGDERLMSPGQWSEILRAELGAEYQIRTRYYRVDPERLKYSLRARQDLGGFHVLGTIDRRNGA